MAGNFSPRHFSALWRSGLSDVYLKTVPFVATRSNVNEVVYFLPVISFSEDGPRAPILFEMHSLEILFRGIVIDVGTGGHWGHVLSKILQ